MKLSALASQIQREVLYGKLGENWLKDRGTGIGARGACQINVQAEEARISPSF